MLLGYYSAVGNLPARRHSASRAPGNPREFNFKYFAPYFQDDWKVTSRLTVNLGLRWDYRNVPTRRGTGWRGGTSTTRPAVCWLPISRSWMAASWMARTTSSRDDEVPRTRIGSRSSLPGSALPGGRSTTRRPSSVGATACSTTRQKAARSTARRMSIRM